MPQPPILPTIDWQAIFNSGTDYDTWLVGAESEERRDAMAAAAKAQRVELPVQGALQNLARDVHVVAIAEDWCGDVVRHVPVLRKLEELAPKLTVRYITRAQHKDVFARYLTNGGEAIPKFIFLSDSFVECGNWGPMPDQGKKLIARGKACGDVGKAREKTNALYQADHDCQVVVRELLELIETASATAP
jgi:hypothetical protein